METRLRAPTKLSGEITSPGDKSISHRALIFNGIAQGTARITNLSPGLDCRSTMHYLRGLGAHIEEGSDGVVVTGRGWYGLHEPEDVLDAGNSGTTIRLLAGLLAALPFTTIITGDVSLRSRPMGRIVEPLRLMGAQIWGRRGDSLAPLAIKGGSLRGIHYQMPVASAQVKSCLLIAALYADGVTEIVEPAPSRDHTERMLQAMGARIEGGEGQISLHPQEAELRARDIQVPGDMSAAAYFLVAGAIHPQARLTLKGVGVNPTRAGLLQVLQEMGARLSLANQRLEGGEPVADITVESSALRGIEVGGAIIPRLIDEIPALAVAATQAQGRTIIRDAQELRVKESDRIGATVRELTRLGARIEELPDGMIIEGSSLSGATVESHGDHRMAMSLAVAGLVASGETIIQGAEVVDISDPTFWHTIGQLSRNE